MNSEHIGDEAGRAQDLTARLPQSEGDLLNEQMRKLILTMVASEYGTHSWDLSGGSSRHYDEARKIVDQMKRVDPPAEPPVDYFPPTHGVVWMHAWAAVAGSLAGKIPDCTAYADAAVKAYGERFPRAAT